MTIRKPLSCIAILFTLALAFPHVSQSTDLESGSKAYLAGDYAKAYEILIAIASPNGTSTTEAPDAQFLLGEMYYYGHGVPQSFSEALEWYRLSAAHWNADAEYSIGHMYHQGEGVPMDREEALQWYQLAAAQGQTFSQAALATLLLEGELTDESVTEALTWLRTAAQHNELSAQYQLGSIYETGDIVPADLNEAVQWYGFAVNQGDLNALEARNRILARTDYVENYPIMLRRLGLSQPDADALFCENFVWAQSLNYKREGQENNPELTKFTNKSLKRGIQFRSELAKSINQESYSENPAFVEIVSGLNRFAGEWRAELQSQLDEGNELDATDQEILYRDDGGVFDLVYHDAFWHHIEMMPPDEAYGLWDYCVSNYMPSGWIRSNIGLQKLQAAERGETLTQQIYYSAVDYGKGVVDWSRTKGEQIKSIDVCEGDLDLPGGIAIGTAATSVMAGESVLMVITSSGILVASTPAIATGVTVTALAGATVYLGARGYCYLFTDDKAEQAHRADN